MIVRGPDGRLIIVCRSTCKNETVYNEKLYNIREAYLIKYKSMVLNPPKDATKKHC
jgi:hypothetical protein